jgi:hypothetical protein
MTFQVKEDHFFHPGPPRNPAPITATTPDAEPLELTTSDGARLAGARVGVRDADVDILYFGGNVSRIDDYGGALASSIAGLRANLFLFDYRGYGRSTGVPTIESLESDAIAIARFVRERSNGRPLVVHGLSLGSFMAAHVAGRMPIDGLVLESTAPDVQRWATNQVPFYAKPFMRINIAPALLEISNETAVQRYTGPLLIITGSADDITPPRFAHALGAASRSANKRVVIAPKQTHGTAMNADAVLRAYAEFLDSLRRR